MNTNVAIKYNYTPKNIFSFEEFYNKRHGINVEVEDNKPEVEHPSCEVYAFKSEEEVKAMIDVFNKHIEDAKTPTNKKIAYRDKMLFLISINIGVRASDLRLLKWGFFFNEDGSMKNSYKIQPKKTKKYKKYVTLYFNDAVKKVVSDYVALYPYNSLSQYVFETRDATGEPIIVSSIWRIIKRAAKEAGLPQNIGSHSLRKTFCYHVWRNAEDKQKALVLLQYILNHSSSETTLRYIGVADDMKQDAFETLNLGLDFI